MQIEASRRGYAFAVVRPGGDRNFEAHTVSVVFNIDEGPRTYIERINLRGNTRTRDYVIRREFDVSEGDAYNRALVDRAERRLKNLDYFKSVKITTEPGSSSDRVILLVDMEEKSTGDFSVSGGYSTTDGALAEVSVSERNLLGRGPVRQGGGDLRPVCPRLLAVVRRTLSARLPGRAGSRPLSA
ncbi:outer membrane protein assembly factor BamA [Bradyrhizobium sp. GM7.3]